MIFDPKGKTFRDDLYPEYKANRPPMPEELRGQIVPVHDFVRAMGMPLLIVPEMEADDVIGTLAREASAAGRTTLICTSDKDMAQLVGPHVSLLDTMKGQELDRDGVIEKHGVAPELIVDYLALMGDKVDNIPGVPSVGPKTAAKWLNQYGSLDELMSRADEVKGKVGENLRDSLEQLPLSRTLTTIKCDVELELGMADLCAPQPDEEALLALFETVSSSGPGRNGARRRRGCEANRGANRNGARLRVRDHARSAWPTGSRRLEQADLFAFDTETTSIDYMQADLVGFSFSVQPGEAAYVPVGHTVRGGAGAAFACHGGARCELRPLLTDPGKRPRWARTSSTT